MSTFINNEVESIEISDEYIHSSLSTKNTSNNTSNTERRLSSSSTLISETVEILDDSFKNQKVLKNDSSSISTELAKQEFFSDNSSSNNSLIAVSSRDNFECNALLLFYNDTIKYFCSQNKEGQLYSKTKNYISKKVIEKNSKIKIDKINPMNQIVPIPTMFTSKSSKFDLPMNFNPFFYGIVPIKPIRPFPYKKKKKKCLIEREGDWICRKCENLNFSFREICNKCGNSNSRPKQEKKTQIHKKKNNCYKKLLK